MFNFDHRDAQQFMNLLDPTKLDNRESLQAANDTYISSTRAVGYSWAENESNLTEEEKLMREETSGVPTPGSVVLPSSIVCAHLPAPAGSKAATKLAVARQTTERKQQEEQIKKYNHHRNVLSTAISYYDQIKEILQKTTGRRQGSIWDIDEVEQQQQAASKGGVAVNAAGIAGTAVGFTDTETLKKINDAKLSIPDSSYSVYYVQKNVTAEDVFLGADFTKTPSTNDCELVAVKVELPEMVSAKDIIALDCDPFLVHLQTKQYQNLRVELPVRCVADKGDAQWDGEKKTLTIFLTVDTSDRKTMLL